MADRSPESARSRAEERFAASERRNVTIKQEIAKEASRVAAKTAKLRALRLAKEVADQQEAAALAAASPPSAAKTKASAKVAAVPIKKFRF